MNTFYYPTTWKMGYCIVGGNDGRIYFCTYEDKVFIMHW